MSAIPQSSAQSTARPMRTRPMRSRTLGDDLLADLRQAAPMPAAQPTREVAVPVESVPATAGDHPAAEADAPTIDVRVTPRLWWGLRMKTLGEGPGVVIGAGPVRISFTGFRR
jgi:hypothetical protein